MSCEVHHVSFIPFFLGSNSSPKIIVSVKTSFCDSLLTSFLCEKINFWGEIFLFDILAQEVSDKFITRYIKIDGYLINVATREDVLWLVICQSN